MSFASNPNGITVNTTGGPTVLTGAQANQLLQKLRALNVPGGGPQTIKIQAIQTNSQTGAKQIVAIPIQSASSPKMTVSPMKMIRMPTSMGGGTQYAQMVTSSSSGIPPGVQIVRVASSPMTSSQTGATQTIYRVQQSQVSATIKPTVVTSQAISTKAIPGPSDKTSESDARGKRMDFDFEAYSEAKRRKTEKGGKGLRHFSMKVCEKVQAKGSTSYNEVADELVNELTDPRCTSPTDQQYDQKNIRRRVYDALNVLMAMNIISKEKKEIRWLGLPTNSVQEANGLEEEKANRIDRIKAKTQQLQDLILQQIAFKNLVDRNRDREKREGAPTANSAIQLPFIIVNTSKKTVIDCSISNDKMEYLFNFDDTFEIHDDMEVLKRMGLSLGLERGQVTAEDLNKARSMVPKALEQYVIDLAKEGPGSCPGIPRVTSPLILKEEVVAPKDSDTDSDVDVN